MIDEHREFMGLGAALWFSHPEAATVAYYDDDRTLCLSLPTPSGELFEVCFNLDYAGVRLFTNLLLEEREEVMGER